MWFEPTKITYAQLLDTFWRIHNPATRNRQGWDFGSQYRSAIFFHSPEQEKLALTSRHAQQEHWPGRSSHRSPPRQPSTAPRNTTSATWRSTAMPAARSPSASRPPTTAHHDLHAGGHRAAAAAPLTGELPRRRRGLEAARIRAERAAPGIGPASCQGSRPAPPASRPAGRAARASSSPLRPLEASAEYVPKLPACLAIGPGQGPFDHLYTRRPLCLLSYTGGGQRKPMPARAHGWASGLCIVTWVAARQRLNESA
jgi:hypothetical protein